jgi:DNA-binding LacI/PurR family transcriptional regulator
VLPPSQPVGAELAHGWTLRRWTCIRRGNLDLSWQVATSPDLHCRLLYGKSCGTQCGNSGRHAAAVAVVADARLHDGYLGSLSRSSKVELTGLPVVDIDPQQIVAGHGRVHLDMGPAVIETVRHLIGEGVARPVTVDVSAKSLRSGRTELFAKRLAEHGADLPVVFARDSSVQAGAAATEEVLRRRRNVDVILCFNDIMACGVLKGLRGRQIEVPERVRVIGIDGLQIGSFVTPQLTSLALNFEQIARAAVELVIKLGQGAVDAALERTVAHRLVVRESG